MTLDPVTQAISRFLGVFDLLIDESRLRQDLLKFKLKPQQDDPDDQLPAISAKLVIGDNLGSFEPDLSYRPVTPVTKTVETGPVYRFDTVRLPPQDLSIDPGPATPDRIAPPDLANIVQASGYADGPGSVVAITVQAAYLADDDLLLDGLSAEFSSISDLLATLDRLDAVADSLQGFDLDGLPDGAGWMGQVKAVLDQFDDAAIVHVGRDIQTATLRGDDAHGLVVDGARPAEAPDWADLLPAHLRPPEDAHEDAGLGSGDTIIRASEGIEGETKTVTPTEHDFSRDFGDRDGDSAPSGNQVVAGGNLAINEIGVGTTWIDASVIVVRGDVAKVQAVSQVNVLLEHDNADSRPVVQDSTSLNIAEITTLSSQPDAGGGDALPADWQLYRLATDLYQVNWTKQITYVTDFDRAEVTFSAQMTFLGLGQNEIVNSAILNEFGYRFDLMFVGGDMVDATIVSQKNVLLDSDSVTGGAGAQMSLADNLLYNKASITMTGVDGFEVMRDSFATAADQLASGSTVLDSDVVRDDLFAGHETLRVLQIDGDLIKLNLFEQENIIGDADQLRLDMQRMQEGFAAQAQIVAGSNALINTATVTENGVDSIIMAGGTVYDDALIHQADWFDTDAPAEGVLMAGLTNDAVAAFLRDHAPATDEAPDAIVPTTSYDHAANLDVMQGVLA